MLAKVMGWDVSISAAMALVSLVVKVKIVGGAVVMETVDEKVLKVTMIPVAAGVAMVATVAGVVETVVMVEAAAVAGDNRGTFGRAQLYGGEYLQVTRDIFIHSCDAFMS